MFWKIVLRGNNPSGRILAVLCARTGETIDAVRARLNSSQGMVLQSALTRESADSLTSELPRDGSVEIIMQRDEIVSIPVLMGYRPGSRGRLRVALQKLSSLPTEEVIRFLTCIPIALKSDADRATAESIKKILEKAGGIVEIRSPNDLVGVSSRKTHSTASISSPTREVKPLLEPSEDHNDTHLFLKKDPEIAEEETCSAGVPPVFNSSDFVFTEPHIFHHTPPVSCRGKRIPPLPAEYQSPAEVVYRHPSIIRFTLPPVSIPPVIPFLQELCVTPCIKDSSGTILIYLFPVSPEEEERVQKVLCSLLDISPAAAQKVISRAPVALTGFSERIDALVTIKELTSHGIPVSLVPGSSLNAENAAGKSFFGWLNGHGRTR